MDTDSIAAKKRKTPKELPSLRLDILLRIGWGEGGRTPDEVSPGRRWVPGSGVDSGSQLSTHVPKAAELARAKLRPSAFATSTRCAMRRKGILTQNRGLPCICPTPLARVFVLKLGPWQSQRDVGSKATIRR